MEPGQRCIRFTAAGTAVSPASITAGSPNTLVTTRFNVFTWLPKSLFSQFRRAANLYFLFIAVIVCFPWSPKSWKSKVFPFVGIIAFTALKDLYEDIGRRREDTKENHQECWVYDVAKSSFVKTRWKDVTPGALLWTPCDAAFPADLMLLYISGSAEAFMSTVNLDGETNLKSRCVPKILDSLAVETSSAESTADAPNSTSPPKLAEKTAVALIAAQPEIMLAAPCPLLTDLSGSVRVVEDAEPGSASADHFVPRGCVLRNTPWILSTAAYVGADTKTRLNSSITTGKVSNMQLYLNSCVLAEMAVLLILCMYLATMGETLSGDQEYNWLIRCLRYAITIYHVVPISLYVCFEILKLWLGHLINVDPQMVDPETGQFAKARTADLVEEMGQVDFVFSDKTGTLTANEMRFAQCWVDGVIPGNFISKEGGGETSPGVTEVLQILQKVDHPQHEAMLWFFTCLSVCHSVQVDEKQHFSGPSPDEVALVAAAATVGITFVQRQNVAGKAGQQVMVTGPFGRPSRQFTILHELEFDSDRKRMSVVCEHEGKMICITKGADNIMAGLLSQPFSADHEAAINTFSKNGLRTLVVASRSISLPDFQEWESLHNSAENSLLQNRAERVASSSARIETQLELAGFTAVEDRLQDGVPDAIATVKAAGIRVWVLTGDKTETAVDIARSARLFTEDMELAYITGANSINETEKMLMDAKDKLTGKPGNGIVLDGQSVKWLLEDVKLAKILYELGIASSACVCCRLSPAQKRKLVEVVRSCSPSTITLAIGDGANDVPMIQGAHIGVGIRGKEGAQAVMASDIAISQFRFLVPLLLCHGRRAYRRTATFLCYYLYKNVTLAFGDIIWAHQIGFTGDVAYHEWLTSMYSAVFTCWPVIFVLVFEQDVPDNVANCHPEIYSEGPERKRFNYLVFGMWMACAAYHGTLTWIIPNLAFGNTEYDSVEFWRGSANSLTLVIFIISMKLFLISFSRLRLWTICPIALSVVIYVSALFYLGNVEKGTTFGGIGAESSVPVWIFTNGASLAVLILCPLAVLSGDWCVILWFRHIRPSPLHRLRNELRQGRVLSKE